MRYESAPALLRGTVLRPLSSLEFTEACEILLAAAREHRYPYWLLGGRADIDARPPDVYAWLSDEFLPRVHRVLGGGPTLAFIARPELWHSLSARSFAPPRAIFGTFRANWFTDEDAALA
ncbi:hypothetical protein GCM10022409_44740 [Hymenobacter glaciei]|uniref:Uncharacterized protein n=1 Tax=Hymenobacter glaciei TaxID=877209 RepID=A0ABP7UU36_9BACT